MTNFNHSQQVLLRHFQFADDALDIRDVPQADGEVFLTFGFFLLAYRLIEQRDRAARLSRQRVRVGKRVQRPRLRAFVFHAR